MYQAPVETIVAAYELPTDPSTIPVSEMVEGEHRWFSMKVYPPLVCCRWCMVVRNGKNKPCKGMAKLRPMETFAGQKNDP